jgi:hypothetical protein
MMARLPDFRTLAEFSLSPARGPVYPRKQTFAHTLWAISGLMHRNKIGEI